MISRPLCRAAVALTVAACLTGSAAGAGRPQLKPGLWEMSRVTAGSQRAPRTFKVCIDSQTLSVLDRLGESVPTQACSRSTVRSEGAKVIADSVCKFDTSRVTSHTQITYQGDTAFRTEIHAHYEPAFLGKTDSSSTRTARWVGACGADMHPGDVTTERGIKLNLNGIR